MLPNASRRAWHIRPVKAENIEDHEMHAESYTISKETADTINRTKQSGGRVIAVGTTSCRTLESIADTCRKALLSCLFQRLQGEITFLTLIRRL